VPGVILAAISPDNTPHGYNWTFAFPMLLFIVIALILYALFSRPHRRIPGRPISVGSTGTRGTQATASRPGGATMTGSVNPQDLDSSTAVEQPQEGTEAKE
jgi:hypothetical protein